MIWNLKMHRRTRTGGNPRRYTEKRNVIGKSFGGFLNTFQDPKQAPRSGRYLLLPSDFCSITLHTSHIQPYPSLRHRRDARNSEVYSMRESPLASVYVSYPSSPPQLPVPNRLQKTNQKRTENATKRPHMLRTLEIKRTRSTNLAHIPKTSENIQQPNWTWQPSPSSSRFCCSTQSRIAQKGCKTKS